MAVLNLVLYPDEPLLKIAEPIKKFGLDVQQLAADMLETMYVHDGVGLAGPQVGVLKRIIVFHEPEGDPACLINPEIYEWEGEETAEEGCLSVPELYAEVRRASRIKVRAFDPLGKKLDFEAFGLRARVTQHETDHLDGIMMIDRLDILSRQGKLAEWEEIRARILSGVRGS